ncbi:MAG: hypothetical protein IPG64_16060 [Haliea sp.]|nr:hypothetical protein [Haliea sp.]
MSTARQGTTGGVGRDANRRETSCGVLRSLAARASAQNRQERILIAAGAGDRIVPPEHPSALWEHWERPSIHWLRGSHIAPVASKPLMRVITQHLRQLDLL